jgi:hypothetical protein
MTYLADVNVWLAWTLYDHVHHNIALNWFFESDPDGIVFCRVTQMGFLRLLTNRKAMSEVPLKAAEAWRLFDEVIALDRVGFSAEPDGLEEEWRKAAPNYPSGPNSWTDAYLGAFAKASGFTVVTFDKAFAKRPGVPARLLG